MCPLMLVGLVQNASGRSFPHRSCGFKPFVKAKLWLPFENPVPSHDITSHRPAVFVRSPFFILRFSLPQLFNLFSLLIKARGYYNGSF